MPRCAQNNVCVAQSLHMYKSTSFTYRCTLQAEQEALVPSTSERAILSAANPHVEHVRKKKKGPKGPNPLSVKKKKRNLTGTTRIEEVEKRKRDESDSIDEASSVRPKRRRRRKSYSQSQGENA